MNSLYQELGGEPVVRQISKKFYEIMDQWPDAKIIRDMHPADLSTSEEKLFMFLSFAPLRPGVFALDISVFGEIK